MIKKIFMTVFSIWMLVQVGDIFIHNARNTNVEGVRSQLDACNNRIKECSIYAPQCNPAIFFTVPKPEDCAQRDKNLIASKDEECRKKVNKAYGSMQYYVKKYMMESGSGCSISNNQ